ncbi:MAG TPA: SpoIIE family protein phosphatase [Spirochaetota bacterium]|nr:SpoIIE family protein phosphatase [Spirochaetota bacterium]HOM08963.1 SpoIIE family protein phosphatase [Spirochaetota bacterium]HPP48900.1 SpoIIE family protein phosphatase [Spirochaetota bacterium]
MKKILSSIDQAVLLRAIEQSPASIVITDTNGIIQYVNPKFEAITGYTFDEAVGKNPRILKSGFQSLEFYQHMWHTILRGEVWDGIFHNKRKDGSFFWEHCVIAPVVDEKGNVTHFVAIKEDITEKKEQEEALRKSEEELRKRNEIISKDLEYAKRVQHSIINTTLPQYPGIKIYTQYIPYDYVGGDFFTLKTIDENLCIFMADITGHGVPAALFSTVLKYAVENLWNSRILSPDQFMFKLNQELIDILSGYFFTAFYGVITTNLKGELYLTYTRCGHPYPLLLSNNTISMLYSSGTLLGVYRDIRITSNQIRLSKNDRLFMFTDGLVEIDINGEKDLRFDILYESILKTKDMPLEESVQILLKDATSQNRTIDDDIAIIALEVC